jgi:hypothetical protein
MPKILTRLGKNGKIRYISRFKTYTYSSFNWIQEIFYVKIIPSCIDILMSHLLLAIWIMDDGGVVSTGLKIATNSFTETEVKF